MDIYDNFIANELKSGRSIEELADAFTRALNTARKQQEKEEAAIRDLIDYRSSLVDIVVEAFDTDRYTDKTIAAVATLAYIDNQKVTKQEAEEYYKKLFREANPGTDRLPVKTVVKTVSRDDIEALAKNLFDIKSKDEETLNRWLRAMGL